MANTVVNKKKGHLFPAENVNLPNGPLWAVVDVYEIQVVFLQTACAPHRFSMAIPLTVGGNLSVGMLQVMGNNSFCMAM